MSKYFVLERDVLVNAKSYMPIAEKIANAKAIAPLCLDDTVPSEQEEVDKKLLILPPVKVENSGTKSLLLMNVLFNYYLNIDLPRDENGAVTTDTYDKYAGGHILNQIERFKSDYELKDKIFDLLRDYKEFERLVDVEIYNIRYVENDICNRLDAGLSLFMTPEKVEQLTGELKKLAVENAQNEILKEGE